MPMVDTGVDTPAEAAICVIMAVYLCAAAINLCIPDTGARYPQQERSPVRLIGEFAHCVSTLWRDKLGQISLASRRCSGAPARRCSSSCSSGPNRSSDMSLSQGAILQAVVAVGIAVGAVLAAARVRLRQSLDVLPVGVAMGLVVRSLPCSIPAICRAA